MTENGGMNWSGVFLGKFSHRERRRKSEEKQAEGTEYDYGGVGVLENKCVRL